MRITTGLMSAAACAVLMLAGGCGSEATPSAGTATTVTVTETPEDVAPVTTPPPAPQETPQETPQGSGAQWVMPNLVGANLQDAQDAIQALTGGAVFYTGSHDLGGQDRNQVLDSNWQVCTQSVASGAALTAASRVDFGVVKLGESCP